MMFEKNDINRVKDYLFLYSSFLIYSLVSVSAKTAAKQDQPGFTLLYIGIEMTLLAVYALLWQQVLKRFSLVVAMSNKGITVIYTMIWSALLFGENISLGNIAGVIIIFIGIWVVSKDV